MNPTVSTSSLAYLDWIRDTTGLSLMYYDVVLNAAARGSIRATDSSPSTGYLDPGYVTPASVSGGNKTADTWSVSAPLPAGAAVIASAREFGLNIALFGVFTATYDRVLDLLNYSAAQCKLAKRGRSIKCADATTSVTVALRSGGSGEAKLTVKAHGRDILLADATALKAYLWLENGDNYLIYRSTACKHAGGKKGGLSC